MPIVHEKLPNPEKLPPDAIGRVAALKQARLILMSEASRSDYDYTTSETCEAITIIERLVDQVKIDSGLKPGTAAWDGIEKAAVEMARDAQLTAAQQVFDTQVI